MVAKYATALVALGLSCNFSCADWKIESVRDGAASRETKRAFVVANAGDANLRLDCLNGAQLLSISVASDFPRGMVGSVIKFDERKPKTPLLQVFSNPRNIPLFDISIQELSRAKHLRIELQPVDGPSTSYDFDTGGGKKAVKAVVCSVKPRSFFRRAFR